jgi:hypothetical protein
MERIIIEWYRHEDNKTGTTELSAYGLKEAIDIVRRSNDHKVVCLAAVYKDKEAAIRSIQQLNDAKIL